MTLTVKFLLIAALILSIIIPFGYFLIGERNKKRYKRALGTNLFFFFGAFVIAGIMLFGGSPVQAAETADAAVSNATGFGYIAAALSTGLSCVGGGIAVAQRGQCSPWCYQRGLQRAWKISDLCRSCRRCLPVWSDHLLHDPGTVIIGDEDVSDQ